MTPDMTPVHLAADTHEPLRQERITGLDLIRCRCGGLFTVAGMDRHRKDPS